MEFRSPLIATLLTLSSLSLSGFPQGEDVTTAEDDQAAEESTDWSELELEELFPEKSLFGPSARNTAFSFDGKYAALTYRPYLERRHGSDLWLYETATGELKRITSVSVMAEFQQSTRKVKRDRVEKARAKDEKEAKKEKAAREALEGEREEGAEDEAAEAVTTEGEGSEAEQDDEDEGAETKEYTGDEVDEDDAEDEDAPRYGGISALVWSPIADELLIMSGRDVYRYVVETDEITRLTQTSQNERSVQYVPDGSGYTFLRDEALIRVTFGSHLIEQLDPKLPDGEKMRGYRLSPDGERLTFLARESGPEAEQRTVNIARYRDRFMEVREVPRTVSDDPVREVTTSVYVYELPDRFTEDGPLTRVYSGKNGGPRDFVKVPEWAPDSSRVCFAVYDAEAGQMQILEAVFPEPEESEEDGEEAEDEETVEEAEGEEEEEEEDEDEDEDESAKEEDAEEEEDKLFAEDDASIVYRFLHTGGPNTPRMIHPYYLADGRRIVFLSEQSGFRQLHVLEPLYQSCDQLTRGPFEVYPFDISEDHTKLFVTATKEHPTCTDVYSVDLESGEMARLSKEVGTYRSPAISSDGKHALANFSSAESLTELVSMSIDQPEQTVITDSHPEELEEITQVKPDYFSFENRHGHEIHGFLFKPDDWTAEDERPLLIYVYGGPLGASKNVVQGSFRADAYFFAYYMAKKHGYVTCTIDPRGMSGYGGLFERANYEQAGKPQTEDLTDGARYMIEEHGVDPQRVGIHGWSFGGFQTQMCMYSEPDVFQVGIAGAGPTEWENYNMWYSTGVIGPSRTGETDLEKYSLLPLAKNLEGKLLLVHGMEDSNVLYQDTVRVYRELLKADKETLVELFLDPTGGHGLHGDVETLARFRKYEEFLLRTLGTGEAAQPDAEAPGDEAKKE